MQHHELYYATNKCRLLHTFTTYILFEVFTECIPPWGNNMYCFNGNVTPVCVIRVIYYYMRICITDL